MPLRTATLALTCALTAAPAAAARAAAIEPATIYVGLSGACDCLAQS